MTTEDFIKAGYQRFDAGLEDRWAECLLQKAIRDEAGMKYFLNVYPWSLTRGYGLPVRGHEAEVSFNRGEDCFVVSLHHREHHTVESIESFFEEVWSKMGADRKS
jgi:hypothetical protein